MVAPLWVNRDYLTTIDRVGCIGRIWTLSIACYSGVGAPPTTYGKHDHSTLTSDALDASDAVFRLTAIDMPVGELQSTMARRSGSLQSALNTWSKFWPWILIWACLIWNFAPIFGQQISILDLLLHWTFWSVLVWTFTLGELRGRGQLGLGHIFLFCHGWTETWLLKSRLAVCERRDWKIEEKLRKLEQAV